MEIKKGGKRKMARNVKLGIATVIMLLMVVALNEALAQKVVKDETIRRGETRATLDPALFNDARVRQAYQAAKEIPWVLDSIYCFCYCEESPTFRHKSLLSCYVDNHAAM